jgi:two-component system, NarL family, sensor kinase
LNPPHLESDSLRATLQRYADGFSQRTGLKTSLRQPQHGCPAPAVATLALAHRAGGAHQCASPRRGNRVSIDLKSIGKQTHLRIRDDGHGFDHGFDHGLDNGIDRANGGQPGGPPRLGVGIPGMSARMQQLGGKLDIRSSRRRTTVHADMPVRSGVLLPK